MTFLFALVYAKIAFVLVRSIATYGRSVTDLSVQQLQGARAGWLWFFGDIFLVDVLPKL